MEMATPRGFKKKGKPAAPAAVVAAEPRAVVVDVGVKYPYFARGVALLCVT